MKFNLLKKALIFLAGAAVPVTGCATISLAISSHKENATRAIPPSFLDISPDGKELFGFKENITVRDIAKGRYNRLEIPEGIEIISPYAFTYMFDGQCNEVSQIVFTSNLKIIGDGAFLGCLGINKINFEDILDGNLAYIGKEAFRTTGIETRLPIPHNVTTIEDYAFSGCINFSGEISIPHSVTHVGIRAFSDCNYLSGIDLLDYDDIPDWLWQNKLVFENSGISSTKFHYVNVKINNATIQEWQEALVMRQQLNIGVFQIVEHTAIEQSRLNIDKQKHILKGFNSTDIPFANYDTLIIPDNVDEIAKDAFADVITSGKIKLVFSGSPSFIRENAFKNCYGLREIDFGPEGVWEIESNAFNNCKNITGPLIINSGIKQIDSCAFANCTGLTSLIFDTEETDVAIDFGVFAGCTNLSMIDVSHFKENDIPLGWYSEQEGEEQLPFDQISDFGTIYINPNAHPDEWATSFSSWGLKKVNVPYTVNDPQPGEEDLFYWSINDDEKFNFQLTDFITRKNSTELLGLTESALATINDKTNIDLNEHSQTKFVENIFDKAFYEVFKYDVGEKDFWTLDLNYGLKKISEDAFSNCSALQGQLVLPSSLEKIEKNAFSHCSHFAAGSLTLPRQLSEIGEEAFAYDYLIGSNLIIPDSVEWIKSHAFLKTNIKKITFGQHVPLMDKPFYDMPQLTTIDMGQWRLDDFLDVYQDKPDLKIFDGGLAAQNGKVIVGAMWEEEKTQWKTQLHNHGLPQTWTIEYVM